MRRLDGSTSSTTTSTSCEVETILPGWTFFLVQDISETWTRPSTPGFQLDERAVVGDVGDAAGELGAHRVLGFNAVPRVGLQLLHAQRDALGVGVDLDDLHLDGVADRQHLDGWLTRFQLDVGDVQQAVDAAEVHERTVVGDVLDHAFADFAFLQLLDELGALFGAGFFQDGATRDDDVAAGLVHLQDRERLRPPISGPTSRTGRMSTCEPGRKAEAPPRSTVKPPLTWPTMTPSTGWLASYTSSSGSRLLRGEPSRG